MPSLVSQRQIKASPTCIFDLCRSVDFHVAAAQEIKARAGAGKTTGLAELGDETTYSARFFGLRFRLSMGISHVEAPLELDDELTSGLFRKFSHNYRIVEEPAHCTLTDTFTFQSPGGFIGRFFDRYVLTKPLMRAQNERLDAIQRAAESGNHTNFH